MPAKRHRRPRDRRAGNPGYEARLNEALGAVASGEFELLREAARDRGQFVLCSYFCLCILADFEIYTL